MSKSLQIEGQKFNKLTVLRRVENNKYNKSQWECQCECGNIIVVLGTALKNGKVKSCGCVRKDIALQKQKEKEDEWIGKTFGRLTVLAYDKEKSQLHKNGSHWICECECGNIKSVRGADLVNHKTQSCGCFHNEQFGKMVSETRENLAGQKFYKLTVIDYNTEYSERFGRPYWNCKCECGNTKVVMARNLKNGSVSSCGCINYSIGEKNIVNILTNNSINYVKEYKFKELGALRYDFYLPEFNRLIEFDGRQHYQPAANFGGQENFEILKRHDEIKNQYAINNNIELVRIPYWQRDSITLDMLLGNQYLIT